MRVIIGSVGRRLYLVRWFKEALKREQILGEVVTTEADPTSAAASAGDRLLVAPPYEDPDYVEFIKEVLSGPESTLFISVNDYEISRISRLISEGSVSPDAVHFVPEWTAQLLIEDKYRLSEHLLTAGIASPQTLLGGDPALKALAEDGTELVIKHRFGSGSSGLRFAAGAGLESAIRQSAEEAPVPSYMGADHDPLSLVVVQRRIIGREFGVDGVYSPTRQGVLVEALARRKDRMRSGETDKAMTVSSAPFRADVSSVGECLGLRGLVDLDFIVDAQQRAWLIDINPRFGGGYPFMHVAGADAPRFFLRAVAEGREDADLLGYETGVSAAKYEDVRRS